MTLPIILWQTVAEPGTTEPETMSLLVEELAEGAKKWQGISLTETLEGYVPGLVDAILRLALAFLLFWIGKRIIAWLVRLCDRTFERQGMEQVAERG